MIKITRRNFLKGSAALGAAAAINGVVLNTLMPSTASADETASIGWEPTTCVGCTTWCAVEVKTQTIGGIKRAIDVTGNRYGKRSATSPTDGDFGAACPRAKIAIQEAYDPDRVKMAMVRTNMEKGPGIDPGFVPMTVDEALLNEVAPRMAELIAASRSHQWAWLRGRYSYLRETTYGGIKQIIKSPNGISHSAICAESENMGRSLCTGQWGYNDYDLDNCRCLILWGVDLLSSNRMVSGAIARINKLMAAGMTVVSIDPRMSVIGAKADKWLCVKPGTDGALALAMAAHILHSGLANSLYLGTTGSSTIFPYGSNCTLASDDNGRTFGLKTWWNTVLKNCDPDSADFAGTGQSIYQITGITKAVVKEVAELFAGSVDGHERARAISWVGPGIAMQPNGTYAAWAATALNAIVGGFDHEGGQLISEASNSFYVDAKAPNYTYWTKASAGESSRKIIQYTAGGVDLAMPAVTLNKGTEASYQLQGTSPTARLAECILDGSPYETKMLFSAMANFAFSCVGSQKFEQAYSTGTSVAPGNMGDWSATSTDTAPPYIVDITTMASETAMFADVVIPAKHLGLEVNASCHPRGTGYYKAHSLYRAVIPAVWDGAVATETEFPYKLAEALSEHGFPNLLGYYQDNTAYGTLVTGVTVTDHTSFDLAANIYHGTRSSTNVAQKQADWAAITNLTTYNAAYAGAIGVGYGVAQATYTDASWVGKVGTGTGYLSKWASGSYTTPAAAAGKIAFYNTGLGITLSGHATAKSTTVGGVLAACNYDRIAALANTDNLNAFVPNYEDPNFYGDSDPATFPYKLIDYKSRLNREGRSANTAWYGEFKNCDPGNEKLSDVVIMNTLDASAAAIANGDTVRITSPATGTAGIVCKVKTWGGVNRGTVAKCYGQGHWAFGKNAAKTFGTVANGGNNNELLTNEFDRLVGSAARNANTRVRIVKVTAGTVVNKATDQGDVV